MADGNNIAGQIADLNTSKAAIVGAIEEKGGTVASGAKFADLASAVATIPQGSGGGTYPIALDMFTDTGYLWLGAYGADDFVSRMAALNDIIGEPYVALTKGPTAGGSGKPCGIFLGYGGAGMDGVFNHTLHFAVGGKCVSIPFATFCTWAEVNLGATVTEY